MPPLTRSSCAAAGINYIGEPPIVVCYLLNCSPPWPLPLTLPFNCCFMHVAAGINYIGEPPTLVILAQLLTTLAAASNTAFQLLLYACCRRHQLQRGASHADCI
jgi:hypothetical protein